MQRRPYILSSAMIVAIFGLLFVAPFLIPISIPLGETTFSLKGVVSGTSSSTQGFRVTATAHPFYSRRLSFTLGSLEWSAAIFRAAPPGDYSRSSIEHFNR